MHEALLRAIAPTYLEAPYIIDWPTVSTSSYYETPWAYSEYTAGGGDYSFSVEGKLITGPDHDCEGFNVHRSLSPEEFGEFVSELFA